MTKEEREKMMLELNLKHNRKKYKVKDKSYYNQGNKNPNWKNGKSIYYIRKKASRPKPEQCEICKLKGRICFDHDHKTKKFRGWICSRCNSAIGFARDDINILYSMIEYLKRKKN